MLERWVSNSLPLLGFIWWGLKRVVLVSFQTYTRDESQKWPCVTKQTAPWEGTARIITVKDLFVQENVKLDDHLVGDNKQSTKLPE